MHFKGTISSQPHHVENRIKFTLMDDSKKETLCVTELDFGQFSPMNKGDHVALTGDWVQEPLDGHERYFRPDSISAAPKEGQRSMAR